MGSVNEISCYNCSFSVNTSNNLLMMVCEDNLDYFDDLYCLNCQKIVKVWRRKNGKVRLLSALNVDQIMFFWKYLIKSKLNAQNAKKEI
jgi:ribosomal protein S26